MEHEQRRAHGGEHEHHDERQEHEEQPLQPRIYVASVHDFNAATTPTTPFKNTPSPATPAGTTNTPNPKHFTIGFNIRQPDYLPNVA